MMDDSKTRCQYLSLAYRVAYDEWPVGPVQVDGHATEDFIYKRS